MKNRLKKILFVVSILLLLASVVLYLSLAAIVKYAVISELNRVGVRNADFTVTHIGLSSIKIDGLKINGDKRFAVEKIRAEYNLSQLLEGRIESLALEGVDFTVAIRNGEVDLGPLREFMESPPSSDIPLTKLAVVGSLAVKQDKEISVIRFESAFYNDKGRLSGSCIISSSGMMEAKGDLVYSLHDRTGNIRIERGTAKAEMADMHLKKFLPKGYVFSGDLSFTGTAAIRNGAIVPSFNLILVDAAFKNEDEKISFSGINGQVSVTGISPLAVASTGRVSVDTIQLGGIPLADAGTVLNSAPDGKIILLDASAKWGGGILAAEPILLDPFGDGVDVLVSAKGVFLQSVIDLLYPGKVKISGRADGKMPFKKILFKPPYVVFGDGHLQAASGAGRITMGEKSAESFVAAATKPYLKQLAAAVDPSAREAIERNIKNITLVAEGLQDFEYSVLRLDLLVDGREKPMLRTTFKGKGPMSSKLPNVYHGVTLDTPFNAPAYLLGVIVKYGNLEKAVREFMHLAPQEEPEDEGDDENDIDTSEWI